MFIWLSKKLKFEIWIRLIAGCMISSYYVVPGRVFVSKKAWMYDMLKCLAVCFGLISFALFLTGCDNGNDYKPEIVGVVPYKTITPQQVPYQKPSTIKVSPPRTVSSDSIPPDWFPPKNREKNWKAIVIHHSLTHKGNAASFDNYHKSVKKWDGIGYDFVVGNGNGSGNGQIEVTYRWREQVAGAHCGGTPGNWANEDAIGICLVGDFTAIGPSYTQMKAAAKLVKFLQKRYNIPLNKIYGHKDTPGYSGGTKCPGAAFPMSKFKSMLR